MLARNIISGIFINHIAGIVVISKVRMEGKIERQYISSYPKRLNSSRNLFIMNISTFLNSIELDDGRKRVMETAKRIMAISPHPDDTEIMAAGYISSRIEDGAEFRLVLVSDGSKGSRTLDEKTLTETRMMEQRDAMHIMGSDDLVFLGYKDTRVPESSILRNDLIREIRKYAPDLVISVDPFLPYESHPDHINTGMAVLQSVLFHDLPLIGEGDVRSKRPTVALGFTLEPNVILDCASTFEKRISAINAHKSQFSAEFTDTVRKLESIYGRRINAKCGESFRVLYPQNLHVNVLGGFTLS